MKQSLVTGYDGTASPDVDPLPCGSDLWVKGSGCGLLRRPPASVWGFASIYNTVYVNIFIKNSCKRPGFRLVVISGMQCDNRKGWFHEACNDLLATAYNKLSKSGHKWVCVTRNTDSVVLLSNIIVLFTGLRYKLSANLEKDSHKTGRQTRTRNENTNKDVDRSTIDGACISTSDDMLKLRTIITLTVIDSLSKIGSPSSGSVKATVVPKNSVGDWTHVNRAKKEQESPSKLNIPSTVRKSTSDLTTQSTPRNRNQKTESRRLEYIFDVISIYRESSDLIWLAIAGDVEHGVPTRDLVRMHDRAPSASHTPREEEPHVDALSLHHKRLITPTDADIITSMGSPPEIAENPAVFPTENRSTQKAFQETSKPIRVIGNRSRAPGEVGLRLDGDCLSTLIQL
ncbi:unnamed protein product [Schistosoma margrebowiei]|uniref:Uncharacterized protein n=1 Tax=Schistosoma margrebowiei TaxID=48269 RepID=A0A183MIW0_9TREM|nr:unnamed protein product [Schistosoma margrebowiei]